jgi:hypothetical protein
MRALPRRSLATWCVSFSFWQVLEWTAIYFGSISASIYKYCSVLWVKWHVAAHPFSQLTDKSFLYIWLHDKRKCWISGKQNRAPVREQYYETYSYSCITATEFVCCCAIQFRQIRHGDICENSDVHRCLRNTRSCRIQSGYKHRGIL